MPPLSLLIKPASSLCNLRCKYCFYYDLAENRSTHSYGLMNSDILELIVRKALEYADNVCTFAFQGGEPTLAGLCFYKKLIEYEKKYNFKKIKINNALQTNGIVIDDEWAKFLHDNDFLVGLSLDGPKDIHDSNRYDSANQGSFSRVMNTVALFNKHKVEYNILFVVNAYVARHASKIYSFFKKHNFKYLQFIPCLDSLNGLPGSNDFSLSPERFAHFLKNLFDLWYDDAMKGNFISIRYFDNLIGILMGYPPENCGMSGICQCQFVFESDGGVYPCDFYVKDEWLLGNIQEKSFEEIKSCELSNSFIHASNYIDPECTSCKWLNICRGGCRRYREPFINNKPDLNHYCSAYREFFEYAFPRLQQMARKR